ncbi:GerAB/ArcD/ProY family transporter [Alicyclobacillus fodiniaquatilis]|uniref:GerAB/ArcD/ProY family transporter n=1 Tax=Alicyclobacillus fodiniaquatilis TaxID=1661150 RepID=A0ABW4JEW6_9BACL
MKRQNRLSRFQYTAIVSSSYFALLFWEFPRIAVAKARFDALWSVFGVIVVGTIASLIQGLLVERFPNLSGVDIAIKLWGKWLGKLVSIGFLPVHIGLVAFGVWWNADALKDFFPQTPHTGLYVFLLIAACRGAWLGIVPLGRAASIIYPITILGTFITFITILFQTDKYQMPHTVTSWTHTWDGVYALLPIFMGLNIGIMLGPYRYSTTTSLWYHLVSPILNGIVLMVAFCAVVLNLGWLPAKLLTNPVLVTVQMMRAHGFLVERLGILIIIIATAFVLLFAANQIWFVSVLAARVCEMDPERHRVFVIPATIAVITVMYSFHSIYHKEHLYERFMVDATWIALIALPLAMLVTAWIRGIRSSPSYEDE